MVEKRLKEICEQLDEIAESCNWGKLGFATMEEVRQRHKYHELIKEAAAIEEALDL
jgi:hypothetical protein